MNTTVISVTFTTLPTGAGCEELAIAISRRLDGVEDWNIETNHAGWITYTFTCETTGKSLEADICAVNSAIYHAIKNDLGASYCDYKIKTEQYERV